LLKGQRQRQGRAKERLQRKADGGSCSLVSSPAHPSSPTLRRATTATPPYDGAPYGAPAAQGTVGGAQYEADWEEPWEEPCELVYRTHAPWAPTLPLDTSSLCGPEGSHSQSAVTVASDSEASRAGMSSWEASEPCSPFDLYPSAPAELLLWPPADDAAGEGEAPLCRRAPGSGGQAASTTLPHSHGHRQLPQLRQWVLQPQQ